MTLRVSGIAPTLVTLSFSPPPGINDEVASLHPEQRVVQRLLGRFFAQGFVPGETPGIVEPDMKAPRAIESTEHTKPSLTCFSLFREITPSADMERKSRAN